MRPRFSALPWEQRRVYRRDDDDDDGTASSPGGSLPWVVWNTGTRSRHARALLS
jgi:hypothetical protein